MTKALNQGQLEAATNSFVEGATYLAKQGIDLDVIVNALIGAMITVCYAAHEDPHALARSFRKVAEQVPALYERQDRALKSKPN